MADRTDVHRNRYDDLEFAPFDPNESFALEAAKTFFPVHEEERIETMDEPVIIEACGPVLTLQHTWSGGTPGNYYIDYVSGGKSMLERGEGDKYCQGGLILPMMRGGARLPLAGLGDRGGALLQGARHHADLPVLR